MFVPRNWNSPRNSLCIWIFIRHSAAQGKLAFPPDVYIIRVNFQNYISDIMENDQCFILSRVSQRSVFLNRNAIIYILWNDTLNTARAHKQKLIYREREVVQHSDKTSAELYTTIIRRRVPREAKKKDGGVGASFPLNVVRLERRTHLGTFLDEDAGRLFIIVALLLLLLVWYRDKDRKERETLFHFSLRRGILSSSYIDVVIKTQLRRPDFRSRMKRKFNFFFFILEERFNILHNIAEHALRAVYIIQ